MISLSQRSQKENSMDTPPVYQEIVDFIAAGTTPQNLIDFCPSEDAVAALAVIS